MASEIQQRKHTKLMLELTANTVARLIVGIVRKPLSPVVEAAARNERAIGYAFLGVVKAAREMVPMEQLVSALSLGHSGTGAPLYVIQSVLEYMVSELSGEPITLTQPHETYVRTLARKKRKAMPEAMHDVLVAGARAAAKPLGMTFDTANPAAIAWAHNHAGELITDITEDVRAAIRLTVVDSFEAGIPPREVARLIRGGIGLTERDAQAVMTRQLKMLSEGINLELATRRAERYATKLLNSRTLSIARSEGMRAANEGQRLLWKQAVSKGLLDNGQQKELLQTDPCPLCASMSGERVGLEDDFSEGLPPFHSRCRCTEALVN